MSKLILKEDLKDIISFIIIALLFVFITLGVVFFSPNFYLNFTQGIHQETENLYQFSKLFTENK